MNMLRKFEKKLFDKLFKINSVLLSCQPVSSSIFHLILFLEFFHDLFLVYHPVSYRNGFITSIATKLDVTPYIAKQYSGSNSTYAEHLK